ncbi:MAG TPA: hypothetical protein VFX70_19880 [Mycobacteriales bacterium]|nr:hypothetical protein [Mycobacteriales bacterium]
MIRSHTSRRPPRVAGSRLRGRPPAADPAAGSTTADPAGAPDPLDVPGQPGQRSVPSEQSGPPADPVGHSDGATRPRPWRPRPGPASPESPDDPDLTHVTDITDIAAAARVAGRAEGTGDGVTEGPELPGAPDPSPGPRAGRTRPRRRPGRAWWPVAVAGVVVVTLGVVSTLLTLRWQRAEARADAVAEAPSQAKSDAARILSYDYRHIRADADAAAEVTTGDYRSQYRQSMNQLIIPQAQQVHAVVQAEVINAGVARVSDDGHQVVMLVYANQTVTNTRIKGSRVDQVRVRLTMVRVGGDWRVSKVDSI